MKNTDRYGVFARCEEKTLQENLFDLASLYSILLKQASPTDPTKQAEFEASRTLLENQRKAYLKDSKQQAS